MFNIYANSQSPIEVAGKINLAISIAAGEHGFGSDYITTETPFVVIFMSNLTKHPERKQLNSQIILELQKLKPNLEVIYTTLNSRNLNQHQVD
jgi:hypothetical protein